MNNQCLYCKISGFFSKFEQLSWPVHCFSVNTKVCQSFSSLCCQPVFQVSEYKLFSVIGHNHIWYSKLRKDCSETSDHVPRRSVRARESFQPTGSSISNDQNVTVFCFMKPVHMQSFPWSAFFPFVSRISQSINQLSTPPASTGSRIPNNSNSSMVLLTFRSSGNGTFRAAQNIGLASGFNLMEALAPFTVGSFSKASALKHRSLDSLL